MRPIKQLGVVANHSFIFFAPAASVLASSSILLLHVTREAFLFISACMLTYAYPLLKRQDLGRYYSRRLLSIGLPYLCWTVIYFALSFKTTHFTWASGTRAFAYDLGVGYYQLYFLVLLLQFYLLFPFLLPLLQRLRPYHRIVLLGSLLVQVAYVSLMHWKVLPSWLQNDWANRELMSYQFYLLGGMVAACHFEAFHKWVVQHTKLILYTTLGSAVMATGWVIAAGVGQVSGLGYESDPFQPIAIPFNVGAILSVYLLGVWLVQRPEADLLRRITSSGAENSYGIYLAQLVFLNGLLWVGFGGSGLPWPLKVLFAAIISYGGSWLLSALLARTPLAKALTGRRQLSWKLMPAARRWRRDTQASLAE
jgi:peptidoglycan/LPS O-acetylase OafA/YrhL